MHDSLNARVSHETRSEVVEDYVEWRGQTLLQFERALHGRKDIKLWRKNEFEDLALWAQQWFFTNWCTG